MMNAKRSAPTRVRKAHPPSPASGRGKTSAFCKCLRWEAKSLSRLRGRVGELCEPGWGLHCALQFLLIALILTTSTCHAAHAADWHLRPVSAWHKLTATKPGTLRAFDNQPIQIEAARGGWYSFQCVIEAGDAPLRDLQIAPTHLATTLGQFILKPNIQLYWENFVRVEIPSGNRELTPLYWPDALLPIQTQPAREIGAHQAEVLWCSVFISRDTEAGHYFGALDVTTNGQSKSLALSFQVHDVEIPPPNLRLNVAVYYDVLCNWYRKSGREFSDAEWQIQKRRYYDFLLDFGFSAYDLPVAWNSEAARKYLQDARVHSVRLPPLESAEFPVALQTLKAANALYKAYSYRIDEPTPEQYPQVLAEAKTLHALDPKLKLLVTIRPNAALQNAVDIWCPNISDALGVGWIDFDRLASERQHGRETWWYTMVVPKYPYATWLLDDDAQSLRAWAWMMARYKIGGCVYSMAHGWGPNPYENLQSFAGTHGDGTLLYPGELKGVKGPLPSMRLMLLREAHQETRLLQNLPPAQSEKLARFVAPSPTRLPDGEFAKRVVFAQKWLWNDGSTALIPPVQLVKPMPHFPPQSAPSNIVIDGQISALEWQSQGVDTRFERWNRDEITWPITVFFVNNNGKYLQVAMRTRINPQKVLAEDWNAIEIAPRDGHESWRFVVTAKNNLVVERRTREGSFSVEEIEWTGKTREFTGYRDTEMQIPLSLFENFDGLRINVLRRVTHVSGAKVLLRAFDDNGDARQMPLLKP